MRYQVHDGAVREQREVAADWLPAWQAASSYLALLTSTRTGSRGCANPACVLRFYDSSRNGTRRWCSMEGCGSRAKAARHYQRHRTGS